MRKIENGILGYIPKNNRCRFDEQKRQFMRDKEKSIILDVLPLSTSIEIDFNWVQKDPDMSVCNACKEVIYGNRYELEITLNNEVIQQQTTKNLCEQCYLKVEK